MPLSEPQRTIADHPARHRVAACGRRFGKSFLAIREMARFARLPRQRVWYVSPTYRQSKQNLWLPLKERLLAVRWVSKFNEQDLSATLVNGSTIALRGADNPDALRGVGLNFLVVDEASDVKEEAWTQVLSPRLLWRYLLVSVIVPPPELRRPRWMLQSFRSGRAGSRN